MRVVGKHGEKTRKTVCRTKVGCRQSLDRRSLALAYSQTIIPRIPRALSYLQAFWHFIAECFSLSSARPPYLFIFPPPSLPFIHPSPPFVFLSRPLMSLGFRCGCYFSTLNQVVCRCAHPFLAVPLCLLIMLDYLFL